MSSLFNDCITQNINKIISNDYIRIFMILITTIFSGYILIPRWIIDHVHDSDFFNFILLCIIGILVEYPINNKKIFLLTILSLIITIIISVLKKKEKKINTDNYIAGKIKPW
jgi:hypothetical protein